MQGPTETHDRGKDVMYSSEAPDLETVMHLIWDRLDEAEARRRRERRLVVGVAAVVLAIAVLWTGMPGHDPSGMPIVMRDGNGQMRARFHTDPESGRTQFHLFDVDGKQQAVLGTDVAGPALTFYDRAGSPRMRVGLEEKSEAPIIDVVDATSGAQSRVDLVSLRAAQAVSLPQTSVAATATAPGGATTGVRRASTRGSRASRALASRPEAQRAFLHSKDAPPEAYSSCQPGLLGCLRWPFKWPG